MLFDALLLLGFGLLLFLVLEFWHAPFGWQDAEGFHAHPAQDSDATQRVFARHRSALSRVRNHTT